MENRALLVLNEIVVIQYEFPIFHSYNPNYITGAGYRTKWYPSLTLLQRVGLIKYCKLVLLE